MLDRLRSALAGRYTIERELGAGGMATVYLAEDKKHHRQVAIKVLRSELAAALGPERFLHEIEIAARLHHPHILPLYDSGEADGFLYYVMPLVEGESLRSRLNREKQLPLDEALQIAREVADALSSAHSHDVVHRDIKPENILLEAGHAVVADFGIARAITAAGERTLTDTGVSIGTPAYMSPEQAAGSRDLDGRSDLYSLGCVLYEMLAGQPPFTGPTAESVMHQHLAAEARSITQLRPAVPGEVAAALARALAKTPADRFNPVGQFAEALRQSAPSGGWSGRQRAPAQPRLRRWILAAVALGVVTLLGLVTLITRSTPHTVQLGRRIQVTLDPGLELDPALSPDGKLVAYVAGPLSENRLFVRQVDGGVPIQVVRGQEGFQRFPSWLPDGKRLLFQSPRGIEIVPALGGTPRVLVTAGAEFALGRSVAPDGRFFVFTDRDSVYIQPLEGGESRVITVGKERHSFAWSPDGHWIAYVSGNSDFVSSSTLGNSAPSGIWVVPATGGDPIPVTDERSLNASPAWMPDGSLLFVSNRDGGRDIYRVSLNRSGRPAHQPWRLTTGANVHGIAVSRDGARLAYSAFTQTSNIWSVAIPREGAVSVTQAQPTTIGNQVIENLAISPDGQWLAFDSDRGGTQQIYRVRLTGGDPEHLTSDSGDVFHPDWSADGSEIAFHGFRGGLRQVFTVPAEGGRAVQVTHHANEQQMARWAPDGLRLVTVMTLGTGRYLWHVITRNEGGRWSSPEPLPLVVESDTVSAGDAAWSPDGRLIVCGCFQKGLISVPAAGGPARALMRKSATSWVRFPQWSADGRFISFLFGDTSGLSARVISASGGTPRVVVRFDDPTRPWHQFGFQVHDGQVYFTLGDLQSDIWVVDVERK